MNVYTYISTQQFISIIYAAKFFTSDTISLRNVLLPRSRLSLSAKMKKCIASRSLARKKEGSKPDLHRNRAEILSTENFPPVFALEIFHTRLSGPSAGYPFSHIRRERCG